MSERAAPGHPAPTLTACTLPLALLLVLLPAVTPCAEASARSAPGFALETGVGFFYPLDANDRDVFGIAPLVNVGMSANVTGNATWLVLDVGVMRDSGVEFAEDPTFQLPSSSFWALPVTLGLRVNAAKDGEDRAARVYLGLAMRTTFLSYKGPLDERRSDTSIGILLEFRPQFRLGDRTDLFVRQRFAVGSEADFGGTVEPIDSNSMSLDVGISWRVKPGYLASREVDS
jgi:hypothetical protein